MAADLTVDEYLARQPEPQRATLQALREQILRLVPEAEEAISYAIPAFKLRGHGVLWIAGWKAHCSLYPLTDAFLDANRTELDGYGLGKGTLRFPPDASLPGPLVEALVRARLADLEADER
ncbi:MAG: DUF1801 domain-containing protein [Candidatus Limnocylindria bacterium]